jgi:hypothetical protein
MVVVAVRKDHEPEVFQLDTVLAEALNELLLATFSACVDENGRARLHEIGV